MNIKISNGCLFLGIVSFVIYCVVDEINYYIWCSIGLMIFNNKFLLFN